MSERADRLRILAARERAAAEVERALAARGGRNYEMHLRAAAIHDAAAETHERAADAADDESDRAIWPAPPPTRDT